VFLVFRSDYPLWELTGGGMEAGETPEQTAIRETKEESGFEIKLVRKVGICYFYTRKKFLRNSHLFEGQVVSGEFVPEFLGCEGAWFKIKHLPLSVTSITKWRLKEALKRPQKPWGKDIDDDQLFQNLHLLFLHPIAGSKFLYNRYINKP